MAMPCGGLLSAARALSLDLSIYAAWLVLTGIDGALRVLRLPSVLLDRLQPPPKHRKQVVIVGASFAGLSAQRELSTRRDLQVTLIDFKDYFEYTPGVLRCFVSPSYLRHLTCALPRRRNVLVQGEVVNVTRNSVTVVDRSSSSGFRYELRFDYLILACGSTYQPPVKPTSGEPSLTERRASWHEAHRQLLQAKHAIIVGAGAVGVELAGELLEAMPGKRVTLVDLATSILPGFPQKCADYSRNWLEARGAVFRLGEKIAHIGSESVALESGEVLHAGAVYKCVGVLPNTAMLQGASPFAAHLGFRDALVVNDQLQVEGYPHIYGVGDAMSHASRELKLGHTAEVNAHLAAANIVRTQERRPLLRYPAGVVGAASTPKIFCLSLGAHHASLGFNWLVLNGWLPALVKWALEWTKVAAAAERPVGVLFWQVADWSSCLLARTVLAW